jgi:hypothetical protein
VTGFSADQDALRAAERALRDGGAATRAGLAALTGVRGTGLGPAALDDAATRLLGRFTGELGALDQTLGTAADAVRTAHTGYAGADADVAHTIRDGR